MGRQSKYAEAKKKEYQEAQRENLRSKGLEQYVIEIASKLHKESKKLEATEISALKASADIRLRLLNKCLPDLKAMELDGTMEHVPHESWLDILHQDEY